MKFSEWLLHRLDEDGIIDANEWNSDGLKSYDTVMAEVPIDSRDLFDLKDEYVEACNAYGWYIKFDTNW